MKSNKVLYIVLSLILLVLIGSSVYVNFLCENTNVISYVLLGQIIVGIISSMVTLLLCNNKKNHKVLFISFLEILFTLGLVCLNTFYGYKNAVNIANYAEYMEYVSMNMNIYLFVIFAGVIGLLSLDLFIKNHRKN